MLAYVSAKKKIVEFIKEGGFKPGDRLPTEIELCQQLDVGRLTLREAMNALKVDGILHSVQRRGTFVACDYTAIADTLNMNSSVTEMIEMSGYAAATASAERRLVRAECYMAEALQIPEGTDVLMYTRVRTADGVPVVYTEDCLSPALVSTFLTVPEAELESLYGFIEKDCGIEIGPCITEIIPVVADMDIASKLEVDVGAPILKLKATVNDVLGAPLVYAREYFRPDKFKFVVTRGR